MEKDGKLQNPSFVSFKRGGNLKDCCLAVQMIQKSQGSWDNNLKIKQFKEKKKTFF